MTMCPSSQVLLFSPLATTNFWLRNDDHTAYDFVAQRKQTFPQRGTEAKALPNIRKNLRGKTSGFPRSR